MRRAWILLAMLLGVVAVPSPGRAENVLRVAVGGHAIGLDPDAATDFVTWRDINNIYEFLVLLAYDYTLEPGLATSWRLLDPLTWEFELRPDVRFHDGTPLTPDDVVFSFERARGEGSEERQWVENIASVEPVGDRAVRIRTRVPDLSLTYEALQYMPILSRAWAERHGVTRATPLGGPESYASRYANGTGAFRLEDFESGVRTVLVRNPDWWGLSRWPHNLGRVVETVVRDPKERASLLTRSEVDFVPDLSPDELERLAAAPSIRLEETPSQLVDYLGMDQASTELRTSDVKGKNPLKDRRVREAVYRAIDIEAVHRDAMRGRSVPVGTLITRWASGWSSELNERLPHDPERARSLLAEAGYPQGFAVQLDCADTLPSATVCRTIAPMLQRVGIRAFVDVKPANEQRARVFGHKTDFFLGFLMNEPDSLSLLIDHARTPPERLNAGGYGNPRIDQLIEAARGATVSTARDAYLEEAWRIVKEDVGYVPLHQRLAAWAMRDNLEFPLAPWEMPLYWYARLH